jgi:hypothetical protein
MQQISAKAPAQPALRAPQALHHPVPTVSSQVSRDDVIRAQALQTVERLQQAAAASPAPLDASPVVTMTPTAGPPLSQPLTNPAAPLRPVVQPGVAKGG